MMAAERYEQLTADLAKAEAARDALDPVKASAKRAPLEAQVAALALERNNEVDKLRDEALAAAEAHAAELARARAERIASDGA